MYNEKMKDLSQKSIDSLAEISEQYGAELILPPICGSFNICIFTDSMIDLTPIHEALFYEGFSFIQKTEDGRSYIEISGAYDFHEA